MQVIVCFKSVKSNPLSFLLIAVTVVKTTWSEQHITPVCMDENSGAIVVVICKVNTGRHRGEDCKLLFTHDRQFHHKCDYRFTLMAVNQTIFLNLTSLTPVDSGNYSCECSYERGTYVVHLDVTVEGEFRWFMFKFFS